jgi:hypothetical protein
MNNVIHILHIKKLSHYHYAGAKGERNYSSNSFLTLALHGGEWLVSHFGHVLPPGKDT